MKRKGEKSEKVKNYENEEKAKNYENKESMKEDYKTLKMRMVNEPDIRVIEPFASNTMTYEKNFNQIINDHKVSESTFLCRYPHGQSKKKCHEHLVSI